MVGATVFPLTLTTPLLRDKLDCLDDELRFGRLVWSTLTMLCVCEEPSWFKGPRNAAVATASLVQSKERGWSWSSQTGGGVWSWHRVSGGLEGRGLSKMLWYPVHSPEQSPSLPVDPLLLACALQKGGTFAENKRKDEQRDQRSLIVVLKEEFTKVEYKISGRIQEPLFEQTYKGKTRIEKSKNKGISLD